MNELELSQGLAEVRAAEERLGATIDRLDEEALQAASSLPGWTRGHVLAHVALNAHSLVNLFTWARTGTEIPQYPSWAERDGAIETHSKRTLAEHRATLGEAGAAFASAARAVPLERWTFEVAGIGGEPQPAEAFVFGRLREVEIHHADLDAGYTPSDWPEGFVRRVLDQVPARLGPGVHTPFAAVATDLGTRVEIGGANGATEVSGAGHELLARSDGSVLDVRGGTLPEVPGWG